MLISRRLERRACWERDWAAIKRSLDRTLSKKNQGSAQLEPIDSLIEKHCEDQFRRNKVKECENPPLSSREIKQNYQQKDTIFQVNNNHNMQNLKRRQEVWKSFF